MEQLLSTNIITQTLTNPNNSKNEFITFFGIQNDKTNKLSNKNLFDKFSILKNKNLNQIIKAQRQATQKVFKRKKIPFRSYQILSR